ncbi:hypothetical protein [Radiobacillus sp. PE A8.2]|uniref:hypothetical protein n=1 Tax=Radiobacillus sp. PE A8.2 TaxID=3380349 RepID=UPI00388FB8B9
MYEDHNQFDDTRNLHDQCKKMMYYHVTITMHDGNTLDGIIENVERDNVTVLVGEDVMENNEDMRYGGYGFGGPRRRYRRFRRRQFPLAGLTTLALLPYLAQPYPYYPSPYPYYPYY